MLYIKEIFRGLGSIVLLFVLLTALATPEIVDAKSDSNQDIVSRDSRPGGLTYGEWSAKWWQWAYSMPIDENPLFDTADCSQGQSEDVWFLGSGFATEQGPSGEVLTKVDRKCTIPAGTMLFFPVINVEGSKLEGNGETERELKNYASGVMDSVTDVSAKIDSVPVENLEQYRVQSPLFTIGPLPDNNALQWLGFDAPEGATTQAVGEGIYLMLEPLSVGAHIIHFSGTFRFTEDPNAPVFKFFKQDVNYEVTVEPK